MSDRRGLFALWRRFCSNGRRLPRSRSFARPRNVLEETTMADDINRHLVKSTPIRRRATFALLVVLMLPTVATSSSDTPQAVQLAQAIAQVAQPLQQQESDYDGLLDWMARRAS